MNNYTPGDLIWSRHKQDGMNRFVFVTKNNGEYFFKVFTLTNLDFIETVKGVDKFEDRYLPDMHSVTDYPEVFYKTVKDKALKIEDKEELFEKTDNEFDDSSEYRIKVEKNRHCTYLKKITNDIINRKIYTKSIDPVVGAETLVLMDVNDVIISYDSNGYGFVKAIGKSVQLTKYPTKLGDNYSMLCGNDNSYVSIGSIDALIYVYSHISKSDWKVYTEVTNDIDKIKNQMKEDIYWKAGIVENYLKQF